MTLAQYPYTFTKKIHGIFDILEKTLAGTKYQEISYYHIRCYNCDVKYLIKVKYLITYQIPLINR